MRWKSGSFPVLVLRKSSCCDPLDHITWLWSTIEDGLMHVPYGANDIPVEEVCEVFGEKVREYGLKNEIFVYVNWDEILCWNIKVKVQEKVKSDFHYFFKNFTNDFFLKKNFLFIFLSTFKNPEFYINIFFKKIPIFFSNPIS